VQLLLTNQTRRRRALLSDDSETANVQSVLHLLSSVGVQDGYSTFTSTSSSSSSPVDDTNANANGDASLFKTIAMIGGPIALALICCLLIIVVYGARKYMINGKAAGAVPDAKQNKPLQNSPELNLNVIVNAGSTASTASAIAVPDATATPTVDGANDGITIIYHN
jgi:hypothetical protein